MFNVKPLVFALLAFAAVPAHADWYLDNESSRLSFVTTKNTEIAEVQRFLVLHGKVDAKGAARLEVELDSINSGIPLRDERMRKELFEIKTFPKRRSAHRSICSPSMTWRPARSAGIAPALERHAARQDPDLQRRTAGHAPG